MTPGAEFHRHAVKLAANGYFPVPIGAGKKNPRLKGWESYVFCPQDAERYLREGCGLLTKATPAIDIDVRQKPLAEKLQALAEKMLGRAPVRIGLAPKCALLYRTSEPFKKMATREFRFADDPLGAKPHRVEILADGQQVVVYGIHPDTKKPYLTSKRPVACLRCGRSGGRGSIAGFRFRPIGVIQA